MRTIVMVAAGNWYFEIVVIIIINIMRNDNNTFTIIFHVRVSRSVNLFLN